MTEAIDRRTVLIGAAGLGVATAALAGATPFLATPARDAPAVTGDGPSLRVRADRKGLLCGSEINRFSLARTPEVTAALIRDCNIIVPGLELKWNRVQPTRDGPLQFAPAEAIWKLAAANRMAMRGHNLTWYRAQPAWAKDTVAALSPGAAGDMLAGYARAVVGHWRGRIAHWDVTNEPVDGDGNLTDPLWAPKLGEGYMDIAFRAAHEADPGALLTLNIEAIEQDTPWQEKHRTAALKLMERLVARGVPVQALGIEGHVSTLYGFSEARYRRFLDEVSALGLKLLVTELDVTENGTLGDVAVRDAAAAALAKALLDVTLSYRNCLGLLTWGQSDRDSWLRTPEGASKQRNDGQPLRPNPLDDDFVRKPLWYAIAAAIDGAPARA
jgi:endo-1,4-beta-xylanase